MAYFVGQTIAASDFMSFRGVNSPSTPFPGLVAATDAVAALIGSGFGSRGYGQTSVLLNAVTPGEVIAASQWNQIYDAMQLINVHTGAGLTMPDMVITGETITANDGSLGRPNLGTLISSLDSARLSYSLSQMALTSVLSSVRTDAWNATVNHEFTASFSNENDARYFFNTGGQIYLAASRSGGTANHVNAALTQMLAQMGTIKIGAQSTTYTGSGGISYPIGYYGLTSTYQTLFVHYGNLYGYTALTYSVTAKVENIINANGGNGSVLRVRATVATNGGGYYGHYGPDGTLTSNISQLKASNALTVNPPIFLTTVGL
jgi:hypothetical protein